MDFFEAQERARKRTHRLVVLFVFAVLGTVLAGYAASWFLLNNVGTSGYTLTKLVRLWVNMFTSFSILPLRVASLFGLLVAGAGMVLALLSIIERMRDPQLPLGWASMMVSVMVLADGTFS